MKHFSFAQHWEGMVEADTLHVEMPSNTSRLDAHGTTSQVSQAPTKSCDSPAMCLNSSWFGRSRLSQIYNAPTMAHRSMRHRYQIGMSLWRIANLENNFVLEFVPETSQSLCFFHLKVCYSLPYLWDTFSWTFQSIPEFLVLWKYRCTLRMRTEYSGLKYHSSGLLSFIPEPSSLVFLLEIFRA